MAILQRCFIAFKTNFPTFIQLGFLAGNPNGFHTPKS